MNKGKHFSSRARKVSMVVKVLDSGTEEMFGAHKCTVSLTNRHAVPIIHKNGYVCFMDLNDGNYTVMVEAEGYGTKSENVVVPLPDELSPVVTITMRKV